MRARSGLPVSAARTRPRTTADPACVAGRASRGGWPCPPGGGCTATSDQTKTMASIAVLLTG
jgi:hypothetical protein